MDYIIAFNTTLLDRLLIKNFSAARKRYYLLTKSKITK